MRKAFLQTQTRKYQQLCIGILRVVYESEYPMTADSIAFMIRTQNNSDLNLLLEHLVRHGHIKIEIINDTPNYTKPPNTTRPRLPLPDYLTDLSPDDFTP